MGNPKKVKRKFLPGQQRFFNSTADEVLYSGAFGAGKSRILCEKILFLGIQYPGINIGVFRKTRTSLTFTTLKTFIQILPQDWIERYNKSESHIVLKNGSDYIFGGLEEPQRWGSLELGAFAGDELIEFEEEDYNMLLGRLRQKVLTDSKGVQRLLPLRQALGATNPGSPNHWLYKRAFTDKLMAVVESKTTDNIYNPKSYIRLMQRFKGRYYERFILGKWISFEGAVYDNWNPLIHIVKPFSIPQNWRRIRVIDFGYTAPFCCLWMAQSPEGQIYVYRQLYGSKRLVEDWAKDIKKHSEGEEHLIEANVCDWDAEDRATLERHLEITTVEAYKDIRPGIQAVFGRLTPSDNKETPRLFFFENSRVNVEDEELSIAGKPVCAEDEFPGYSYPKTEEGKPIKEIPLQINDHGLDATRYGVMYFDTAVPAEGVIIRALPVIYDVSTY